MHNLLWQTHLLQVGKEIALENGRSGEDASRTVSDNLPDFVG